MANNKQTFFDRAFDAWWGKVLIGAFILLGSVAVYSKMERLEAGEVDTTRSRRTTRVLYDIGGKWGAAGVVGAFGVGMIAWGAVQATRRR